MIISKILIDIAMLTGKMLADILIPMFHTKMEFLRYGKLVSTGYFDIFCSREQSFMLMLAVSHIISDLMGRFGMQDLTMLQIGYDLCMAMNSVTSLGMGFYSATNGMIGIGEK